MSTTPTTGNSSPEKGNWNYQKSKLKEQFPTLTDSDLQYEEGKKDFMFTRLQTKLGITRTELDTIISEF
ncbi:MAG TPA: general stress protein CsbD [Chitinophagales bacterium]|nr:general stress protein CsbD [Chitinophagales bacterium]